MSAGTIDLGKVQIPAEEYASLGNAILGIRDSGKTSTAMYIAERLLEYRIPFVAFDPIGTWRFIKVPGKGKGYEVVVAGEDADLPLTPQSAPEIVRAAMHENIPLIIDLYSMELAKADWRRIVEQSLRTLLYENKKCGLRHIFIEEAAEFAPQRVMSDQGKVYAEMEKLARMGGNAMLGYTLINARAEEVNKAILELCDCLFLHRQKGRNSLIALGKWLDVADAEGSREIIKSLPSLPQGTCWAWISGSDKPVKIKVPLKQSFYPDRRQRHATIQQAQTDVSTFVQKLSGSLEKYIAQAKENDPAELRRQIEALKRNVPKPIEKIVEVKVITDQQISILENSIEAMKKSSRDVLQAAESLALAISTNGHHPAQELDVPEALKYSEPPLPETLADIKLRAGEFKMLQILCMYYPDNLSLNRLATLSGFPRKGGTFKTYLGVLQRKHLAWADKERAVAQHAGRKLIGNRIPVRPKHTEEILEMWRGRLRSGEFKMLKLLTDIYPESCLLENWYRNSGFPEATNKTYAGVLRRNGLIEYDHHVSGTEVRASVDLFGEGEHE